MQKEDVKKWVATGPDSGLIVKAQVFGEQVKRDGLTTSQIRQVFTKLKSIEAKQYCQQRTDFVMLKPFLAYAAGRQSKVKGLQEFKEKITWGIDAVLSFHRGDNHNTDEGKRFKNFCTFFEAVLAYHRASGGK